MPIPTPFHQELIARCESLKIKNWAGFYGFCTYNTSHDPEYFAIRHGVGLIDVSPLFKYEVKGADAGRFLSHIMVKDVSQLKVGQVTYLCWCDDKGKVLDDGTVTRLSEDHYRVTAAEPSYYWFSKFMRGYDVTLEDSTDRFGALSVQGPNSKALLAELTDGKMADLKFFRGMPCLIAGKSCFVSRTGYTGDLGYEVWCEAADACDVLRLILKVGEKYAAQPAGLDAMDVARVEAGFIMNGVDYFSANRCIIEDRKSTPYELGLGWAVQLDRDPFIGQKALAEEVKRGSNLTLVGLSVDWVETEELFGRFDLPPEVCSMAWRDGKPVYDLAGEFIGKATSGAWSPTLKKNLALASVLTPFAKPGTRLKFEMTVEYQRHTVSAIVIPTPFFNPPRKRA